MAALLFAAVDTVTKVLTASHGSPVTLVAWARSTVHLVLMTALLAPRHGRGRVTPARLLPVLLRSLSRAGGAGAAGLHGRGVRAGLRRRDHRVPPAVARLGAEQPLTLRFTSALVGAAPSGVFVPFSWSGDALTPSLRAMFLALGILAGVGHVLLTLGYRHAPASTSAPVSYLHLDWAGIFGVPVSGHRPDPLALRGRVIIAGSGIATVVAGNRAVVRFHAVRP